MVILLLACTGTLVATPDPTDTAVPDTGDTGVPDTGDTAGETGETGEDTGPSTRDADRDGYSPAEGDCDDERAHVYPGAPDYCDGLDADCDGEPIPPGSCSLEWDPTVMWTWDILPYSDTHPEVLVPGDVGGGPEPELVMNGWVDEPYQEIVTELTGPTSAWPAKQYWGDPFTGEGDSSLVILAPVPIIDSTADGRGDLWVLTETGASVGGAFLFPGRDTGFGTDFTRLDEAAEAYWVQGGGVAMSSDPRSGSGDINGDGIVDLMVRTTYQKDEQLAVIFGGPDLSGTHSLAELPAMWVDVDQTRAVVAQVVGDLDGDGLAETLLDATSNDDLYYLAGADFEPGAHLGDAFRAVTYPGGRMYNPRGMHLGEPGDLDGDGVVDGYLGTDDGAGGYCAVFTTGTVPEGDIRDVTSTEVCNQGGPSGWIDDIDDDGSRDPTFGDEVVPSSRLRGGGRFEEADVVGPIIGWKPSLIDTADLDGDGYPEWLFDDDDSSPNGRTLIVKGFPIPWEDASKW